MAHNLEEEETHHQNSIEDQEYFNTLGGYDGKNNHIKCKFCEYTCLRKNLMKSHIAIVHDGMKPYQCTMCNYSAGKFFIMSTEFGKNISDSSHYCTDHKNGNDFFLM